MPSDPDIWSDQVHRGRFLLRPTANSNEELSQICQSCHNISESLFFFNTGVNAMPQSTCSKAKGDENDDDGAVTVWWENKVLETLRGRSRALENNIRGQWGVNENGQHSGRRSGNWAGDSRALTFTYAMMFIFICQSLQICSAQCPCGIALPFLCCAPPPKQPRRQAAAN